MKEEIAKASNQNEAIQKKRIQIRTKQWKRRELRA
jgi:hypothetical protein